MDLVSVIVPIYNVEEYLDKCVESIVNQTYKNLEIILVDDGSPDNCPFKCEEWQEKDSRIKVIHKENGGLSSARNAGLRVLKGRYVCFIDSDDYIESNMIDVMVNAIESDDFDICVCDTKHVDKYGNVLSEESYKDSVFYGDDVLRSFIQGDEYDPVSVCDKLYAVSIIKENTLWFDELNKWGEDFPFNYSYFKFVKKLISVSDCLYNYLIQRDGSITNGVSYGRANRWRTNYKPVVENEKNNYEIHQIALTKHARELMCCCRELLGSRNKKLISECYPSIAVEVKNYYKDFISLKSLSLPVQFSIRVINFNPNLFKCLYTTYVILKSRF